MIFEIKNFVFSCLLIISSVPSFGQPGWSRALLLEKLDVGNRVPENLLASRSVVFYTPSYNYKKLREVQRFFQQTGVDAVAYFPFDRILANRETTQEAVRYFSKREISFLIFLDKEDSLFSITFTRFNKQPNMFERNQAAWKLTGVDLNLLLGKMYRTAIKDPSKKNLLINDQPEIDLSLRVVKGKSLLFFSIDLKVDRLAVPWFGEAKSDSVLFHFFKENYPFKFGMVNGDENAVALREKNFLYKLNYVYADQDMAKTILNYPTDIDMEKDMTLARTSEGDNKKVYKFYTQYLFSGDVFLGTLWDADTKWEKSLRNYIGNFKKELGL